MKNLLIITAFLTLLLSTASAQCIKDIKTNPLNPVNNEFLTLKNDWVTQPEFSWRTSSNKNLRFKNANSNKVPLSLSPNGKVGINTEDFFDDHDLYVNGSVYIKGDSPETYSIYIEGIGVAEEFVIKLKSSG